MATWPSIDYRSYPWAERDLADIPKRRRATFAGPYRAAVVPAIATAAIPDLPHDVIGAVAEASAEISRLDAEHGDTIAPFSALLLRSESAASSKIENLTASVKAIALAELGDPSRRNAAIIVANTRAMEAAIALADRIDEQAILDMHETLLGSAHPDWVGKWRQEQVWIGGSDYGPHDAAFVPPHQSLVAESMADLVAFMRRDDVDPFIASAIAHAQFETIHPFPDGNGRTGRALLHSVLRSRRLVRNITIPVSAGLLADTNGYFDALTHYREGRIEPLLLLLSDATQGALVNARRLVLDLQGIEDRWHETIRARRGAGAWRVADLLLRQPIIDSPLAHRELGLAVPNVNKALEHLVDVGIVKEVSGKYRNRKFAANEVLDALDRFAKRASRRK